MTEPRVGSLGVAASAAICVSMHAALPRAVAAAPVKPSVRIYDAPADAVAALSSEALAAKRNWRALEQGDTAHRFGGCAVLLNDKLAAVLGKGGAEVALYSRQTRGLKLCARLEPTGRGGAGLKPTALAVIKNTTGSASVRVACRSAGGKGCHVTYTMTVGQPFIETAATAGVERLRVRAPCRFAVMPDFFGDDMVVEAAAIPVTRAELPSENFLLHMLHDGEAIVMTVSASRDADIGIALSGKAARRIDFSEVAYGKKPQVWVAVLAGEGVWHERTVRPADADKVLKLEWRMPFPALWRVDWRAADGLTDSWGMLLQHPDGRYVMQDWFGGDPDAGQRFGPRFGPRDWNKPGRKRWNPVLSSFSYPCWVDKDGRGYLQPLAKRRYVERGEICNFDGPAIVYPLGRVGKAPFRTPIDRLTVVDLVRMTLGVGPCRYILDLEGQKRNSEGVATCYARDVINAIYKSGTQRRQAETIEKHLDAAVAFIRNVRERIDEYVTFAKSTKAYLERQKRLHPRHAKFLDELVRITGRLDAFYQSRKERIRTPQYAKAVAEAFRKDLLNYTGADAYAKCNERMRIFTGIGGSQDGLVASCRMIVKTLRQRAGIAMATNPDLKEIAAELRARTQKVLRGPTAYEAPQH